MQSRQNARARSRRRPMSARSREAKAAVVLDKFVDDYPGAVDDLFTGAGLHGVKRNAANLGAALRRGDIKAGDLYDGTIGTYNDLSGTSPIFAPLNSQAAQFNAQNAAKDKSKFENILSGLLGTASQAVDIYNKARSGGAGQAPAYDPAPAGASKPFPWLIAGGAALVVVLILVLVLLKKK
jgi:hypothetical protein